MISIAQLDRYNTQHKKPHPNVCDFLIESHYFNNKMPSLRFFIGKQEATVALKNINIYLSGWFHIFFFCDASLYQKTYEKNKKKILLFIFACSFYDESFFLIFIYEKYVVLLISITHAHKQEQRAHPKMEKFTMYGKKSMVKEFLQNGN